jgi:hypothetical protein
MIIIRHELWNIFKGSSYEFKILLGIFDVFLFVCSKDKHTAGGLCFRSRNIFLSI